MADEPILRDDVPKHSYQYKQSRESQSIANRMLASFENFAVKPMVAQTATKIIASEPVALLLPKQ